MHGAPCYSITLQYCGHCVYKYLTARVGVMGLRNKKVRDIFKTLLYTHRHDRILQDYYADSLAMGIVCL